MATTGPGSTGAGAGAGTGMGMGTTGIAGEEVGKFVQANPDLLKRDEMKAGDMKMGTAGMVSAIPETDLPPEADDVLLWLCRYPVERNHPRATTDTIPLWKSNDVMCVSWDETVPQVLKKLIVEGFLSAPVLDQNHTYIGFVDMLDLLWHTLTTFGVWRGEGGMTDETKRRDYFASFLELDVFRNTKVGDILTRQQMTIRNPFHPVFKGFSLFHVIELMARVGVHRVPVINAEGKIIGIVTQSMVISLFDQHLDDKFGDALLNMPVGEMIPCLASSLECCTDTELVVDAFKKMVQKNISGLAVVDREGKLADTLSVRDLRGIGVNAEHFERMWMTVKDFKAKTREEFPQQTPATPIYVTPKDNFLSLIRKMDDGNIHRVFVCQDDNRVPTHVITQRDVMRILLWKCGLQPAPITPAVD